ncbi:MAG: orotidine 5'-phosphate decarboxylase / HUMPS family protein [Promethearchaeota archaeon]
MPLNISNRYVQIAFNKNISQMLKIVRQIKSDDRIIIEAGTPFIKLEGMRGIRVMRNSWRGLIVADLKISDGASYEVEIAKNAGADAITAAGMAPIETLDKFTRECKQQGVVSMIDMLGVINPLEKIRPLHIKPDCIVIHKGRDEEENPRSVIRYKDINKIRSKYDVFISIAGGLDIDRVRSVYFNGGHIAILNITSPGDPNVGLSDELNFRKVIPEILSEVGR